MYICSHLTSISEYLGRLYLFVVMGIKDDGCCCISAVVGQTLRPMTRTNTQELQL